MMSWRRAADAPNWELRVVGRSLLHYGNFP